MAELHTQNHTSLAGATLFAMTRYVESPCVENAQLVARHLECAAEQQADPRLADLCFALALRWRGYIMRSLSATALPGAH
ncbi:hypothetical protein [Uliginosibacterium sediminicola]|jgi:hypothetical protein|uniref:Uncharacterized protein n=1 Tax=Uliginosibacterium sediminicola TaxID=2024550 RepID=A0ABU9Z1J7_9RHOO